MTNLVTADGTGSRTFANAKSGIPLVPSVRQRVRTHDIGLTYDRLTIDGVGAFLIGELERLDQKLHDPLVHLTWSRDIDLREDVSIADEQSSFTNSSFASPGGIVPGGKNWISTDSNAITGVALDIGKTIHPLYLWGTEIKYTIPELLSSQKLGRPVDAQKFTGMKLKHQMDIDNMVYTGDTTFNQPGLCNYTGVGTTGNVINGAAASPLWANKTPQEILNDVNTLLTQVWTASGFARVPSKLLLPPVKYSYLVKTLISSAGNSSVLKFLQDNSIALQTNGKMLDIQPCKWLTGLGVGGTDRMVAYTQEQDLVRFPMVPLQRTPLEYRSIYQMTTYFGRLGVMEFVYPETVGYADGF
jgi:hypothetical protein